MFETTDWRFTLDSRPDHSAVLRKMSEDDIAYAMTHVSVLERVDGAGFDAATAWHVLYGIQSALSFALGRWVAPALPVGLARDGRIVWEQWVPWRCDPMFGFEAWWDGHRPEDLADMTARFLDAYLDDGEHWPTRHFSHHVILANHAGTTGEAKIMLAQAGIEYLAWVDYVISGELSETQHKKRGAAGALRRLLERAGVPTDIPQELGALCQLAAEQRGATDKHLDGPAAITAVRNRLVHPKVPQEAYRIEGLVHQTAQLLLGYCELILLHRLGYTGKYLRRFPPHRFAHASDVVPWSDTERTSKSS